MPTFHNAQGPFMKSKNTTNRMMMHVLIALLPIVIFSFIKNGVIPYNHGSISFSEMLYPLMIIMTAVLSSFLTETIYAKFVMKKEKLELLKYLKNSYAFFPGLFMSLVIPINTPLQVVVFGAVLSSLVGKLLFGGFGKNIFNPALIGVLFVITMYGGSIATNGGYLNKYEYDTISHSTPLSSSHTDLGSYNELVKPYGSLVNFFVGTIPGAIGETSALLIILAFCYLTIFKVIKWRIPVVYILTVFGMTYMIGGMNDIGPWYPLFQILSGGLLFGAVFMATDPVTSPVTETAQILYGLFLGILTVVFRYLTPYPEGVLTAILTMNMFVFILDKIGSQSRFNFNKSFLAYLFAWILIIGISLSVGSSYLKEETVDKTFEIISKEETNNKTEYVVTQKGFVSTIKARVLVSSNGIEKVEILEQNESYYQYIIDANYLETLETNDIENIDTVSGATRTSTALKEMIRKVLADYEKAN